MTWLTWWISFRALYLLEIETDSRRGISKAG